MKIKTALTLKNTGVIAVVFLLCMTLIYLVSEHIRSNTFFHNLKSEAVTKVHLFLQNQVDADIMQSIYLNNKELLMRWKWLYIPQTFTCSTTMPSTMILSKRIRK